MMRTTSRVFLPLAAVFSLAAGPAAAQMRVERFDTLPTASEIASFKAYILTVNRMLRTDENWSESNMPTVKPTPRTKAAAPTGKFAHA